jgi:hydroxymethylpyrimidine pyrophosphatase-like HAD family hydrolase
LITSQTLTEKQAASALEASIALKRGFFAFEPPPDCHRFLYQDPIGHPPTSGYLDRLKIYQNVAAPYKEGKPLGPRGQFLITAPKDEMPKVRQDFEKMTEDLSIFYSTSPFGDASLWLEIFPNGVNKGSAARDLTVSLGHSPQDTLAIGNDFNDLDMLAFASQSFVTADASLPVRSMYPNLPASSQAPMAHLLNLLSR